jgi:hypothetical protein
MKWPRSQVGVSREIQCQLHLDLLVVSMNSFKKTVVEASLQLQLYCFARDCLNFAY